METITKSGIININGTNINFSLTNNKYNSESCHIAHLEFISLIDKKPNALTKTGYRSHFFGISDDNITKEIQNNYKQIVREVAENIIKENNSKIISFSFGEKSELPNQIVTQTKLF